MGASGSGGDTALGGQGGSSASELGGQGAEAGNTSGEAGAPGGAGGEGGESLQTACVLPLECQAGEQCLGSGSGQVCVPRAALCPSSCSRNDGCNADGSCIAPRALGAACSATYECAPGSRCGYDAQDEKRCITLGTFGDACKADEDCAVGLGCSFDNGEAKCDALAGLDAACTNISCQAGLICALDANGAREVCRTTPAGAAGSYCDVESLHPKCDPGLACTLSNACRKLPALGQSCQDGIFAFDCEPGAFCAEDHVCHSVTPAIGELCRDDGLNGSSIPVTCQAGSYCREESGFHCVAETPIGDPCTNNEACAQHGFCGAAGTCVLPAALGASCSGLNGNGGTCVTGFCNSQLKCQAVVADGASCTHLCPRYGYCPNPCSSASYCSTESNKCFASPTKDGPCVAHASGDNHFLCDGQWCCPAGQVCNADLSCTDKPAPVGKSCEAASSGAIGCAAGAFCNASKKCQAYAETYGSCSGAALCGLDDLCRTGQLDGACE